MEGSIAFKDVRLQMHRPLTYFGHVLVINLDAIVYSDCLHKVTAWTETKVQVLKLSVKGPANQLSGLVEECPTRVWKVKLMGLELLIGSM